MDLFNNNRTEHNVLIIDYGVASLFIEYYSFQLYFVLILKYAIASNNIYRIRIGDNPKPPT